MKWRWWRTRAEQTELLLQFLMIHGEVAGPVLRDGTHLRPHTCDALLAQLEAQGRISSREDPAPRIGRKQRLYQLVETLPKVKGYSPTS